jgi:hypothetical protein
MLSMELRNLKRKQYQKLNHDPQITYSRSIRHVTVELQDEGSQEID